MLRVVALDVDIESGDPLRRNGLEGLQVIGGVPLNWRCALELEMCPGIRPQLYLTVSFAY